MRYLPVICISSLLAACGGGGGGSAGNAGATGAVTSPAMVVSPGSINLGVYPGDSAFVGLAGALAPSITDAVYTKMVDAGRTFGHMEFGNQYNGGYGGYGGHLEIDPGLAVGHHTGKVELHLCRDANCGSEYPGSPVFLPYDVEVRNGENLTPLSAWSGVPDWGTYHGNNAQTGYVPVTLDVSKFSQRWRWSAAGNSQLTAATIANGKVYVGAGSKLYALSERDASVVWSRDFTTPEYLTVSAPAVANGKVYAMLGQSAPGAKMYSFDAATGSQLWAGPSGSYFDRLYAPIVVGGLVLSNASTSALQAFSTINGTSPWQLPGYSQRWSPASDGKYVYTYGSGYPSGMLLVTDPATGHVVKNIQDARFRDLANQLSSAPVLGAPGSVFAVNVGGAYSIDKNQLVNFDVAGGKIKWALDGRYDSTPAYAHGVVYVFNHDPFQLEARAEADGALLWSWVPPSSDNTVADANEILLTNNLLFARMIDRTVAVDLSTHKEVWNLSRPGIRSGTLALSANGVLYITGDTLMIAVNVK